MIVHALALALSAAAPGGAGPAGVPDDAPPELLGAGPAETRRGRLLVAVFLGAGGESAAACGELEGLIASARDLPVSWWIFASEGAPEWDPPEPARALAGAAALARSLGVTTWPQAWIVRPDDSLAGAAVRTADLRVAVARALEAGGLDARERGFRRESFVVREGGGELVVISIGERDPTTSAAPTTSIAGRIVWLGAPPGELEPFDAPPGPACDVPPGFVARPRGIELGPDGGVRDAIARRLGADAVPPPVPFESYDVLIDDARFAPRVLVVPVGARVRFSNRDRCGHVVHVSARRNPGSNQALAPGGSTAVVLSRRELVAVTDDLHPWMRAWICVTDTAHAARTDETGAFGLEELPPGVSEVELWHPDERVGRFRVALDLSPGERIELEVVARRWR